MQVIVGTSSSHSGPDPESGPLLMTRNEIPAQGRNDTRGGRNDRGELSYQQFLYFNFKPILCYNNSNG